MKKSLLPSYLILKEDDVSNNLDGNLPLYIYGYDDKMAALNLYSAGPFPHESGLSLYTAGPFPHESGLPLFISGPHPSTGTLPLYLYATLGSGYYDGLDLYSFGAFIHQSGLNLFTHSLNSHQSGLNLFSIASVPHSSLMNMFLYCHDPRVPHTSSLNLFTFATTRSGLYDLLPLYTTGPYPSGYMVGLGPTNWMNLYVHGHGPGTGGSMVFDDHMNMAIRGHYLSIGGTLPLYLYESTTACRSGIPLYTKGLRPILGSPFEPGDGFYYFRDTLNMFCGKPGLILGEFRLYLENHQGSLSGMLNLMLPAAFALSSGLNLYASGIGVYMSGLKLYTRGF